MVHGKGTKAALRPEAPTGRWRIPSSSVASMFRKPARRAHAGLTPERRSPHPRTRVGHGPAGSPPRAPSSPPRGPGGRALTRLSHDVLISTNGGNAAKPCTPGPPARPAAALPPGPAPGLPAPSEAFGLRQHQPSLCLRDHLAFSESPRPCRTPVPSQCDLVLPRFRHVGFRGTWVLGTLVHPGPMATPPRWMVSFSRRGLWGPWPHGTLSSRLQPRDSRPSSLASWGHLPAPAAEAGCVSERFPAGCLRGTLW